MNLFRPLYRSSKLFIMIGMLLPSVLFCQVDSVGTNDSLWLYKRLKNLAAERKFTRWLYQAVFVDPEPKEYPKQPATDENKNVNPYLKHERKIIRNINIRVYDPFGYSAQDTVPVNTSGLQNLGNRLHIKTREW